MNVALYARVSSVAQDVELSLSAQLKALREYASAQGYIVVDEYVDEAKSGRTSDRTEFSRMIAAAKLQPAPFEQILVWKLSRFSRNREDAVVFKSFLRRKGVRVVSINEQFEDGPSGRLVEGIIESIDEFYSANLAQDVVRGMRETASRGFWVSSNTPYGYRRARVQDGNRERTRLEIEPDEADIIRTIFGKARTGTGTKEIAKLLNELGVNSPGGKRWGKATVHATLTNPVYKGTLVFGKRGRYHSEAGLEPLVVEGAVPAIVVHRSSTWSRNHWPRVRRSSGIPADRRGATSSAASSTAASAVRGCSAMARSQAPITTTFAPPPAGVERESALRGQSNAHPLNNR